MTPRFLTCSLVFGESTFSWLDSFSQLLLQLLPKMMLTKHELTLPPAWCVSDVTWWIILWLTKGSNICQQLPWPVGPQNKISTWQAINSCDSNNYFISHDILHLISMHRWLITSLSLTPPNTCILTNCDAFIPSSIPLEQALALTEQSVMAMFIVHALNRRHMAWAAVSGAKFVPLCSFRGYLWLAPCWLDALLADNGSLCVTDG